MVSVYFGSKKVDLKKVPSRLGIPDIFWKKYPEKISRKLEGVGSCAADMLQLYLSFLVFDIYCMLP